MRNKVIVKGFDSLQSLGEWYDTEVFQDISGEELYAHDRVRNVWYCYRWTSGRREIVFVKEANEDLPLFTQVYPPY